jgi:predicted nucleotidyltransferase
VPLEATADPILIRFRAELDALYGERIERVVLFGSRARGDARADSDYDVAVFLKDYRAFSTELDPLVDAETTILFDTGAVINALPFPAGAYNERTGFMHELRRDGRDLSPWRPNFSL